MITWMQRHKKWLIITIWISTIAFVGAGFVGWGQYRYGDKASAVAKVGDVEISMSELQKSYSRLYQQYAQMLQGNFDEAKAKEFGVQRQALQQLIQQAYLLNLAKSYDLTVSDLELFKVIKSQKIFYTNGVFDREKYKRVVAQNRVTTKEYENGLRRELLLQKTLALLPVKASKKEIENLNIIFNVADKIEYKIISAKDVKIDITPKDLKVFWEKTKNRFMSDESYKVSFIEQKLLKKEYNEDTIVTYYNQNKTHFRGEDGKILPIEKAKEAVIKELNAKASKDAALRKYIAFKKGKIDTSEEKTLTISATNNPLGDEALKRVKRVSLTRPYTKPILFNNRYYIIKLIKTNPSQPKSFEDAKKDLLPIYIKEKSREKLLELAKNSLDSFNGEKSDYITLNSVGKIDGLTKNESVEFLQKLFTSDKKRAFIALQSGKVLLYNILEQKLLDNKNRKKSNVITQLKSRLFSEGLLKTLQNRYKTEIFIKGL